MFRQCKVCKKITFKIFFAKWWKKPRREGYARKIWGTYRTHVCKACVRKAINNTAYTAKEVLLNQYHEENV